MKSGRPVHGMRLVVVLAVTSVALIAAAFGPASASAATWSPCMYALIPIDCATYDMPADRTGAFAGTTKVRAMRQSAPEGPRMGTIFVLAGGPGQGSAAMMELMASLFGGANRYDVVAIDQRGSGESEPLNCPRIESGDFPFSGADPKGDWAITQCSDAIGGARVGYNTAEAVADIEAIRADLGVGPIALFGVSYGTKLAMAYAKTYPQNTRSLLLDSLVPVDEPSSFDTDSLAALRTALGELCGSGRCKGINRAPVTGLTKVASRLGRTPIPSFNVTQSGRVVQSQIDDDALFNVILQADFNLFIFNQLPSAISTALRGDYTQISRLYAIASGLYAVEFSRRAANAAAKRVPRSAKKVERKAGAKIRGRDAEQLAAFSNTMNIATTCADLAPPWTRGEDLAGRQAAIVAAANALPNDVFSPFSRSTIRDNSLAAICRGWRQSTTQPAIPAGPLPDVPTLALNGSLDLRTPVSWAQRSIAGSPKAELAVIAATGHSVIGTDVSGCALSLAKRFLIFGSTDGKCNQKPQPLPVAPVPPRSLAGVSLPRGSCRGVTARRCTQLRRALYAGYLAMRDSVDQLVLGNMFAGPGLYGGSWFMDIDISDDLTELLPVGISMLGLSNVPGTSVSGSLDLTAFPLASGSLRITTGFADEVRVNVFGRVAYDRANDRLTLTTRGRNRGVSARIGRRSGNARAAVKYVNRNELRLRVNYSRAAGLPPAGAFAR